MYSLCEFLRSRHTISFTDRWTHVGGNFERFVLNRTEINVFAHTKTMLTTHSSLIITIIVRWTVFSIYVDEKKKLKSHYFRICGDFFFAYHSLKVFLSYPQHQIELNKIQKLELRDRKPTTSIVLNILYRIFLGNDYNQSKWIDRMWYIYVCVFCKMQSNNLERFDSSVYCY